MVCFDSFGAFYIAITLYLPFQTYKTRLSVHEKWELYHVSSFLIVGLSYVRRQEMMEGRKETKDEGLGSEKLGRTELPKSKGRHVYNIRELTQCTLSL